MSDSVAVDAKRILLRYGAPIAVLDKVSEVHRIEFAREIAMTALPKREPRLRELLAEHGYMEAAPVTKKGRGKSKAAAQPASTAKGEKPKSPAKSEKPKSTNTTSKKKTTKKTTKKKR